MTTVREVLSQFEDKAKDQQVDWPALEAALLAREDQIREELHVIAMRLGTFPEFVAFAFAEVGLGTPPTEEGFQLLHRQFHERMEYLQQQFAQQQIPEGGSEPMVIANDQPLPENLPTEVQAELRAARMAMGWCDHGRRLDECSDCTTE